ncbi:SAM-dependent methyltransferase [Pacificimonas flava]|uniref:SAM-dependent methyltransferase n=2 Tax=Pacificimonas TaxID=1960290 RepID=A0A219B596_9SPHN|nr:MULTISPECIES: DUF938 domain-containing protein [Pacificimonas]MBZ6379274.1 DUF938 domain-containing protein [Pacificimonas aurantium]OWV33517.1 SAM-dependent methyltransferase [Pacificimonas flava]
MTSARSPAAQRNRTAIWTTLAPFLPASGRVLMIAEGTGEHAAYFAAQAPQLDWLPSDPGPEARSIIAERRKEEGLTNLLAPIDLNAAADSWPVDEAVAITCINMVHISPWSATEGLFRGASRLLPDGASLYLYGPYRRGSRPLEPSNERFDESLRARDAAWGLREVDEVVALADTNHFSLALLEEMPANNLSLVFRR